MKHSLTQRLALVFMCTALSMLVCTLIFGALAAHSYTHPGIWKDTLGFVQLRPFHVSSALFWIILGATGGVVYAFRLVSGKELNTNLLLFQLILWLVAMAGIFGSYAFRRFGGREYWEFPPLWALPIALSWILLLINYVNTVRAVKHWPVYVWMWLTGILFFLFTFIESYLWVFPYFRSDFVRDMTIQWKASGAMVGAWNQLIYGLAFFLMERISGDKQMTRSKMVFAMYFLGLFNLLFNWSHHVYTLPTDMFVRYVGYAVSMTEWILLIRIIWDWRAKLSEVQRFKHRYTYRFLMAADAWVFLNLGLAILMSIPAINVFTHGTHITVAHAMGTTIGINTMILLAACIEFMLPHQQQPTRLMTIVFWVIQGSLLLFWLCLLGMGVVKGLWQLSDEQSSFQQLLHEQRHLFLCFSYTGTLLMLALGWQAVAILVQYLKKK